MFLEPAISANKLSKKSSHETHLNEIYLIPRGDRGPLPYGEITGFKNLAVRTKADIE